MRLEENVSKVELLKTSSYVFPFVYKSAVAEMFK